nr:uncharacterized protein CI109_003637 [Kwoniella shandongensis]KAA5527982.1 hypothetical protein CI109_003637 [Kwoniella shandongensis]
MGDIHQYNKQPSSGIYDQLSDSPSSSPSRSDAPRPLARNSACHQCRKRKLKCDAAKPVCTNCQKPRVRGANKSHDEAAVEPCTWDDHKEPSARTRRRREMLKRRAQENEGSEDGRASKSGKLGELEDRIAAFEGALAQNQSNSSSFVQSANQHVPAPHIDPFIESIAQTTTESWLLPNLASGLTASDQLPDRQPEPTMGGSLNQSFELVSPDWPQDLPTPAIVEHAVQAFFAKIPTLPKMFHKSSFLQSLRLPPSHPEFPSRPLLHAILAMAAFVISETSLATRAYFPVGSSFNDITHPERDFETVDHSFGRGGTSFPRINSRLAPTTPLARFQTWHRRKAFSTFQEHMDIGGEKLLQCIQGYVIATAVDQYNAWWTDLWLETGACMRLATPLRLNESPNVPESSLTRFTSMIMGDAETAMGQAERDRIWWVIFIIERAATGATTWAPSLADEEITVELPVKQSIFDKGYIATHEELTGTQTLHILIGYISHPTFRVLLSKLNGFRMSFPPEFRRPTQAMRGSGAESLDRDLVAALWITHGASVSLGEPLVTRETWTSEGARMTLSAIRASLSLLYDITATSYDLTLLPAQCSFAWSASARGLVRFIDAANQSGDQVSVAVFQSELQVFRMALSQFGERFPVGKRHLKVIDDLLAYPDLFAKKRILPNGTRCNRSPLPDRDVETYTAGSGGSSTAAYTPETLWSAGKAAALSDNAGKINTASPAYISNNPQEGWDINSFSFDVDAMASLFEATGAMFDGTTFNIS